MFADICSADIYETLEKPSIPKIPAHTLLKVSVISSYRENEKHLFP